MEMEKEHRLILEMVAGGKITAEDAEKLFQALEASSPAAASAVPPRPQSGEPGAGDERLERILRDLGVKHLSPRLLRETRAHGFTPEYLSEMKSLGMKFGSLEKLIALRSSRVSKEMVRELAAMGFKDLDIDTLVQMGIHRVSVEEIRELREMGITPAEGLEGFIRMRILNISPRFVAEIQSAGLGRLTLEQIFECKIHHITGETIREYIQAGYPDLTFENLLAFRIHRVTGEYLRELREAGYPNLTAEQVLACRIHRVSGEIIRELRAAGFDNLSIEEIIELRKMNIHPGDLQALRDLEAEIAAARRQAGDAEKTQTRPPAEPGEPAAAAKPSD